jgi:hypothetical protein
MAPHSIRYANVFSECMCRGSTRSLSGTPSKRTAYHTLFRPGLRVGPQSHGRRTPRRRQIAPGYDHMAAATFRA